MTILVLALLISGAAGAFLAPMLAQRPALRAHCTSFAAGVLLGVILTHVIPESMEDDHGYGGTIVLVGFIGMLLLQQKVLKADPCCGHEHAQHAGLPSYLAMVTCSINDGLILSGVPGPDDALFWAMCGHKITACFALVMLLRETTSGLRPAMRTLYMVIFVAITPIVLLLSQELSALRGHMHYLVALGAGALLYVICGGMIPRVEHSAHDGRRLVLAAFLFGAVAMILVALGAPHEHGPH